MKENDPLLLPHLEEARNMLTKALSFARGEKTYDPAGVGLRQSDQRNLTVCAVRRLIAYLAGKPARAPGTHGHTDEPLCDRCFLPLRNPADPMAELCRRCLRAGKSRKGKPIAQLREEDEDRRTAIEQHTERIQAHLAAKPHRGAPRKADLTPGIPTVGRKNKGTKKDGPPSSHTPPDAAPIAEPSAALRVLALMLARARWRRASAHELWHRSRGALTLEQVQTLLLHPWFSTTERGTCTLTALAWSEFLDEALQEQQQTG